MVRDEFQLARLGEGPRPARRRRARSALDVVQVEPAVWRTALELAGGDPTRRVVDSPGQVRVMNRGRRRS